jgi:hypothetical protein
MIMTPVKPQISKFQAEEILSNGFQRATAAILTRAFVKRVKSSVQVIQMFGFGWKFGIRVAQFEFFGWF